MVVYNKFEVPINIISPIHIGAGETYTSKEFFYSDDEIFRINLSEFFKFLDSKSKKEFINNIQNERFTLNDMDLDIDTLNKFSKYSMANHISQRPKYYNEIECAAKSLNKPYIPGSSIKGSIKNALFFNLIQSQDIPEIVFKIINNNYEDIMTDYFSLDFFEYSAQSDIMRFLQISDSNFFEEKLHVYELTQLNISKRKYPKLYERKIGRRLVETIPESKDSNLLKTTIKTNFNNHVFSKLNFTETINEHLNINKIAESLVLFADAVIDYEIEFFSKYHENELVDFYENLMDYNYYNKPLILLGLGTGIHTKTIFLKIKEYDKENGTNYSTEVVKKLFNAKDDIFPKTRKIIRNVNKPLGWVQIDLSKYISKND